MLRYKRIIATLVILIVCVMVNNEAGAIEPPEVIDGQYLIMMKAQRGIPDDLDAAVSQAGGELVSTVPEIGMAVAASEAEDFAEKLAKHKAVMCVIPDLNVQWIPDDMYTQQVTPSDEPLYGYQWNMPAIDAPGAWDAGYTGSGVRVADLDTGITPGHPDLFPNIDFIYSTSFVPSELFINDLNGHGTWTAGIIAAADNAYGVIGVAPEATIIAVKVLDGSGSGAFSWILNGIVYAAVIDVDVINMSLSGYFPKSGRDPEEPFPAKYAAYYLSLMNAAVNFATQQGVVVVSSAGNDAINLNHNEEWVVLPAEAGNGMAASATGPLSPQNLDAPASYTNFGTSVIDVAAPGGNGDYPVLSTFIPGVFPLPFAFGYGTSASAPHVSGVAALIIEKYGGGISPALVKGIIEQSADDLGKPGMDDYYGRGRINAHKAVSSIP